MSAQLIREQLSKRNLKEPTAVEEINSSRAIASSRSKNNGKTSDKRSLGTGLKCSVETSTQTCPDRLVNGHSQKVQRQQVSIAHQNTCVQASDVVQVHEQESSKAPKIDESLISDGDEGLPFISAVYSLASPENGLQMSDHQVTNRPTDKPDVGTQASGTPLVSIEKPNNSCDSGKDISRTTPETVSRKPAQSPSKVLLMSNGNETRRVMSSGLGNAAPADLSSPNVRHEKNSSNSVVTGTKSDQHFGSQRMSVSESPSLTRKVVAATRNAGPMVSVALPPTLVASSPCGTGTGYNLRKSSAASPQTSSRTGSESRVTASTAGPTSDSSRTVESRSRVGTSSQSGPVGMTATVKVMKTNTVASPVSAPKSSSIAGSPILISPNYGARKDQAGQLILIPDPQKSATCAMTSLVQLVNGGTSSVTSGAPALKPSQVITTKTASLPVLVPATRPQQRVVYKFSGPASGTASGSPRTLPNQPLMITGNSLNGPQGQTVIQILTPDGPMLLVPVSKSTSGAAPTQLVLKGNSVVAAPAPATVQIVKTASNTTRTSVPIAPYPGSYPVMFSASPPAGSQNVSSHVTGPVNGGGRPTQRVSITTAAAGTPILGSSTVTTSVAKPPLVLKQVNSVSAGPSQVSSTVYSQSHVVSKGVSKDSSVSAQTTVVSGSSKSASSSVSMGLSPQEARIQRLKELLRVQEQAVDRLRNKRQREMENVRESTIIGRSNADTESAVESEAKTESTPFALPLPPKKMKPDVPHSRAGGKNEIEKKKAEGFLPNGDDKQFVQLVGLESIVEKLKNKKRQEAEARVRDVNSVH